MLAGLFLTSPSEGAGKVEKRGPRLERRVAAVYYPAMVEPEGAGGSTRWSATASLTYVDTYPQSHGLGQSPPDPCRHFFVVKTGSVDSDPSAEKVRAVICRQNEDRAGGFGDARYRADLVWNEYDQRLYVVVYGEFGGDLLLIYRVDPAADAVDSSLPSSSSSDRVAKSVKPLAEIRVSRSDGGFDAVRALADQDGITMLLAGKGYRGVGEYTYVRYRFESGIWSQWVEVKEKQEDAKPRLLNLEVTRFLAPPASSK